jgi:hypothetical protein
MMLPSAICLSSVLRLPMSLSASQMSTAGRWATGDVAEVSMGKPLQLFAKAPDVYRSFASVSSISEVRDKTSVRANPFGQGESDPVSF